MNGNLVRKSLKNLALYVLITTMLLATACSKTNTQQSQQNGTSGTTEALTLPVTTTPITLTYWCDLGKAAGTVTTLNENLTIQEWQKRTGVTLKYIHPAVGNATVAFNLICASGQYPDIMEYGWLTVPGGPAEYIKNNVIIPLNSYIKQYAPDLTKNLQKYPLMRTQSELDDGTYYMMPSYYGDLELARANGPIIREDLLKKQNLSAPVTIDDWTKMLEAVKKAYPDMYPFYFAGKADFDYNPLFIGAYGISTAFSLDKGKVIYGAADSRYKSFLQLLNTWYKEGLIDPDSLSGSAKLRDSKYTSNKTFAIIGAMGDNVTRYTALMLPKNPDFMMNALPYPIVKKGDAPAPVSQANQVNGGVAITTACKYVKEAVKMLDYLYTDEGHLLSNFGVEGTTYTTVDGKPQLTPLIINNPAGLSRTQAMAKYLYWQGSPADIKFKDILNARDSLPQQISGRADWMKATNSIVLPPVLPTKDESTEISGIMSDITTYTEEQFNGFVSGKIPLSNFDSYINKLKDMNIARAIQITQQEYDRYSKRK
jgi:putative aldouronate transport system substrate-binding protein